MLLLLLLLGGLHPSFCDHLNFSAIFKDFRSPAVLPFYPDSWRTSDAPLGVPVRGSRWEGLARDRPVNFDRWWRLLRGLDSGEVKNLTVIVLGGSMTFGTIDPVTKNSSHAHADCGKKCSRESTHNCPACAFPVYFETYLKHTYPFVNVVVSNWAIGACDSHCSMVKYASAFAELMDVDAVYLNFKLNDYLGDEVHFPAAATKFEELVLPSSPVVIDMSLQLNEEHFPPHTEITDYYQIPVLAVEEYANRTIWDLEVTSEIKPYEQGGDRWWPRVLSAAARAIGFWFPLTRASSLKRIRPKMMEVTWDVKPYEDGCDRWWPVWDTGRVHPGWPYHRVLGEFISLSWELQRERAISSSKKQDSYVVPPKLRNQSADVSAISCWYPHTYLQPTALAATAWKATPKWQLGEDMLGKGKHGWWIDDPLGGSIQFNISLRKYKPLVGLVFLQSYKHMGRAVAWVDDDRAHSVVLHALNHLTRVSVSVHTSLCIKPTRWSEDSVIPSCEDKGIHLDRQSPDLNFTLNHTLTVSLLPSRRRRNKFKILGVISC